MLAYYIHDLSPFLWEIRPGIGLRWYGLMYVLAFVLGGWLYRRLAERGYSELKPEQVGDFITWAALFGVLLGGRLGWVLFYGLGEDHSADPWWWPIEVWKGGMASHGGILGLVLFTLWYARRNQLSWTSIGDTLCVVAPVGLLLVRAANFINGELFGKPACEPGGAASVPWAVIFPTELGPDAPPLDAIRHDPAVREHLRAILPPRHPSQIYEGLLEGVLLFTILWLLRTRLRMPRGAITGVFFICYALLRITGELFRVPDPAWSVGSLSAGQFLSLFLIVIGAVFLTWALRNPRYERAQSEV
jgi:phosphatidylglycerol:prolipoprotein diacylglycerol transferase